MDRFRTTLCLNGVRTSDGTPLHVVDAQTLSLNGKRINADDIVERALPSRVATAIEMSMAAAPPYSSSVFFLLGSQVHHGRLGDAVVNYVIRDQARHRSLGFDRQVSQRGVVMAVPSSTPAAVGAKDHGETPLQYEECLVFAYDEGAVACETLRASDTAATIDEVLGTLRVISFVVFKYALHKSCVVLVGSHLSTTHMAALLLASRRHVFLYVDSTMSAQEVESTTAEMRQVRDSLCAFALPLDEAVQQARAAAAAVAADAHAPPPPRVSRTLDAVAHSKEEYELLWMAMTAEGFARVSAAAASPARAGRTDQAERAASAKLQQELEEVRAAQQATEADLKEQRQTHRKEVLSLREEIQRLEDERSTNRDVAAANGSLGGGRSVSQNLMPSFQQQSQSHLQSSTTDATVAQLQHALQDALKAQKFAEEKVHLLELRQFMFDGDGGGGGSARVAPVYGAHANGSVVSPRPSLRLPTAALGPAPTTPTTASWEQSLLQQENTALVAEFQRKEKEWQQRLHQASLEVAQLRQEKAVMEATLQLQSQTISAAQQALLDSRAVQEQEMSQVLRRVRTLSQESRSRHRNRTASAEASAARATGGSVHDDVQAGTPPPPRPSPASSAKGSRSGGMMSPPR
ncbi:hypothetical protein ABB37_03025 [Leptomonas pyrrhocoris]|uniref:Uncharacterized protein n=1 Tax=Leptomonas pyrrhocoris TaxID=157538 RepID=A0A0N0VGF8_LEPPY|nr:hypothetical protein ABB37_03025 [Leptomonas pyrrhocoris]KPA83381.1 hypothetical protein ABB37_03025 [Leptomonas pyrrhocoris]|eukprot:XP_015661820.1 hypothetical protein ABB37_03025 [Leptomonas pyrrhocoris]